MAKPRPLFSQKTARGVLHMTELQNGLGITHFCCGIAPSGTSSVRFSFSMAGRPSDLTPAP